MSKRKKSKKKVKNYVISYNVLYHQKRFLKALSLKEARQMFDNENFDTEYDFQECCEQYDQVYVEKVRPARTVK